MIDRFSHRPRSSSSSSCSKGNRAVCGLLGLLWFFVLPATAETVLLRGATVHTVTGGPLVPGDVLLVDGRIAEVGLSLAAVPGARTLDLAGMHLYPGLMALDTQLGLAEIGAVRATVDTTEVGQFTPDVCSWMAVTPDSELIPVARANGVALFQPVPLGGVVAGQSALLQSDGWTYEQMIVAAPAALHVYWPVMDLNTTPKDEARDPSQWKSLDDQAQERDRKLRELASFFDDARAYAAARAAGSNSCQPVPAWEAMLPFVRGERPVMVHADELRQINAALDWSQGQPFTIILAGGRDAWLVADRLAERGIPVVYRHLFTLPPRDTASGDVQHGAPAALHRAGVKVAFSVNSGAFPPALVKNLAHDAGVAVRYGLPNHEALRAITLNPAIMLGVDDRFGSIEVGKVATLFAADGDILDIRTNVKRMWIHGREVSLSNRHTELHQRYRTRPRPQ
jgi:imidazolonepropionase-like amidohydrolase